MSAVPSVALNYTEDGPEDAPVLVLGSSLGTDLRLWAPQVPLLAERYRVVRYDHRGHGRSPVPPGPYELADLGGDVLALLDHLGAAQAHLAGISLGGMAAMWVAAHAPDRVDRLALVCTSARTGSPQAWADRAAAVRSGGLASIADAVVTKWTPPEFARQHPDVVEGLREVMVSTPPDGYAACCAAIENMDLEPELGRVTAPTLVLAGLEDTAIPPAHGQRVAALIPGARLTLLAGAAHLANVSQPELVGQLLADFLSGTNHPDDDTLAPGS